MASTFEKNCFLCNVKEIDGNSLVDSQESSLILFKVLNVPHLMNDLKKLENINYCHPCKKRILKIQESLEILKKLEKEVLEEKYLIKLQLETNYKIVRNEYYSLSDFGVILVNEMKFESINSKLKKVADNQIDRKFCSKRNNYRIMKNITITEKLKLGTFEEHISKETTPPICNIISSEKQTFVNHNHSFPSNGHFVDSPTTNSLFNQAELPLTSHVFDFDEIKLELLSGVTNDTTDVTDPFEGIVPESSFATENSTTQRMYICGTCETNFVDYSQLDEHCCTHIGSKFCSNENVSIVSLNENSYIHTKNFLRCRFCVKVFSHRSRLKRHESIHSVEKLFKCEYCSKTFRDSSNMKSHERIHTGEKPFKCRYCDKTFRDPRYMKSHESIHDAATCLKCKFCGKNFSKKSTMEVHERTHTEEKPFKCKYCDKTFRVRVNLNTHEHIHTAEKLFKCRYCDKTFRNPRYMKSHERIHDAVTCLKCKFCDKSFFNKSTMEAHVRIHTGEKPFKCRYCDKTFGFRVNLNTHEHIHTAEKLFKCRYCDKTFRNPRYMKSHERIHDAATCLKCKFCDKSFFKKSTMEAHVRIHTGEKP